MIAAGTSTLRAPGPPASWARRNLRLLAVFGPVLIATGIAGLTLPARFALLSNAVAYDLFHIGFGVLGTAFVLARAARLAALFNLVFGAFDLYQAAAGVAGVFPAHLFALRPADHVAHVCLGGVLVFFGASFLAAPARGLEAGRP